MSSKVSVTADSSTHGCSSRMPGVSMSSAPPGSSTRCRAVVVWRPLPSTSLISAVFSRSWPSSRLTSVDLPTPDDPMSATVWAGERYASSALRPSPLLRADRQDVDKRQARANLGRLRFWICAEVCLVEHDDGNGARVAHDGEIALETARIQIFGERGDEEDRVDVGGHHLLFDGAAGGLAGDRAAALEAARDDARAPARLRAATLIASARQACAVTHTQSPTAGKSAVARASCRNFPLTSAHPSKSPATRYAPRCSSTMRATCGGGTSSAICS